MPCAGIGGRKKMVFVFGYDVPLIEILLIFTVAMIAALFILIYYVAKIFDFLVRMDKDLARLEKHVGAHVDLTEPKFARLKMYVQQLLLKGLGEKEIRERLLSAGWESLIINEVFEKIKEMQLRR